MNLEKEAQKLIDELGPFMAVKRDQKHQAETQFKLCIWFITYMLSDTCTIAIQKAIAQKMYAGANDRLPTIGGNNLLEDIKVELPNRESSGKEQVTMTLAQIKQAYEGDLKPELFFDAETELIKKLKDFLEVFYQPAIYVSEQACYMTPHEIVLNFIARWRLHLNIQLKEIEGDSKEDEERKAKLNAAINRCAGIENSVKKADHKNQARKKEAIKKTIEKGKHPAIAKRVTQAAEHLSPDYLPEGCQFVMKETQQRHELINHADNYKVTVKTPVKVRDKAGKVHDNAGEIVNVIIFSPEGDVLVQEAPRFVPGEPWTVVQAAIGVSEVVYLHTTSGEEGVFDRYGFKGKYLSDHSMYTTYEWLAVHRQSFTPMDDDGDVFTKYDCYVGEEKVDDYEAFVQHLTDINQSTWQNILLARCQENVMSGGILDVTYNSLSAIGSKFVKDIKKRPRFSIQFNEDGSVTINVSNYYLYGTDGANISLLSHDEFQIQKDGSVNYVNASLTYQPGEECSVMLQKHIETQTENFKQEHSIGEESFFTIGSYVPQAPHPFMQPSGSKGSLSPLRLVGPIVTTPTNHRFSMSSTGGQFGKQKSGIARALAEASRIVRGRKAVKPLSINVRAMHEFVDNLSDHHASREGLSPAFAFIREMFEARTDQGLKQAVTVVQRLNLLNKLGETVTINDVEYTRDAIVSLVANYLEFIGKHEDEDLAKCAEDSQLLKFLDLLQVYEYECDSVDNNVVERIKTAMRNGQTKAALAELGNLKSGEVLFRETSEKFNLGAVNQELGVLLRQRSELRA